MTCRFTPKTLTLALATLCSATAWSTSVLAQPMDIADPGTGKHRQANQTAITEQPADDADSPEGVAQLDKVEIFGDRSRDEIGYDNVYDKDISNVYVDRQYLERYRGVSTGDVFSGMNGVYNSDNRNGSALFPNIRGIAGNGRIPVTVDGTVQSIDVWMGANGINNRNYLDPNLFRSIEVEKGPSMTRGIKSGIAGSVSIRTIDAGDIIEPGNSWGVKLNVGTANNSVRSSFDAHSLEGVDYRDVPGAQAVFLPLGYAPGVLFNQSLTASRDNRTRFDGSNRRVFMAAGYQHERFDALAVYSNAQRGNFFSGKKGASKYLENGSQEYSGRVSSARNMYPNMARIFEPGQEVPYTDSKTESFMLKNNWLLDHNQKISLNFTRNNLEFGEVPSVMSNLFLFNADNEQRVSDSRRLIEYPFPASTVRQNVYRIGYELKPEGSPWLDLEASLWRTTSQTNRYQNGDTTYQTTEFDRTWNHWVECNNTAGTETWSQCQGLIGAPAPAREPNTDGRYDIRIATRLDSRAVRNGFDISNRFRLSDTLSLTASADWQYERIKDIIPSAHTVSAVGQSSSQFGPASGRREEYGSSLNLDFQATDRLQISVGARYGKYWGFDDETANQRAAGNRNWERDRINTHQKVEYRRLLTEEEVAMSQNWAALYDNIDWEAPDWETAFEAVQQEAKRQEAAIAAYEQANGIKENSLLNARASDKTGLWTVSMQPVLIAVTDGKADPSQNPFYNGTLDFNETVTNPNGVEGTYYKYQPQEGASPYFTGPAVEDPWERPEKQRAAAWSTQLVASYRLTDRARTYIRYASMARFPSILESGNRAGRTSGEFLRSHNRPERNNAWEVGYTYNFSHLIPGLQLGDIKLNYYHNTIHDFFDRTNSLTMIQLDRKIMSGIELQSRFDTGGFHGGLGVSYRLRQQVCDKDYALMQDPFNFRIPECMDGGLPSTLSFLSLQPRYSLNLDLGARLLERKLDIGVRMRYHSRAANKSVDRMLEQNEANGFRYWNGGQRGLPGFATGGFNRPYYWDSVTLIDLYAEYRMTRNSLIRLSVDNLTDRYYLDPLTRVVSPAPGRTVMLDMSVNF